MGETSFLAEVLSAEAGGSDPEPNTNRIGIYLGLIKPDTFRIGKEET